MEWHCKWSNAQLSGFPQFYSLRSSSKRVADCWDSLSGANLRDRCFSSGEGPTLPRVFKHYRNELHGLQRWRALNCLRLLGICHEPSS